MHFRRRAVIAALTIALTSGGATPGIAAQAVASEAAALSEGTPVKLMVLKEVDSRTARPGDRFKLRVDQPVSSNGVVAIPVGTTAWGEVLFVDGTGAAGGKGRLSARLLYLDLPSGRIPITGTQGTEGKANTAGLVLGVVSFGLLGLLTRGGNAHFKAGDILTGYIERQPATAEALPAG